MSARRGLSAGATVAGIVTAAAFGPYLTTGIRTEQIAVYGSLAVLAPLLMFQVRPTKHLAGVAALWGVYALIAVIGAFARPVNQTQYADGPVLAGLDNALLPLAVIAVVVMLTVRGDPYRILRAVAVVLVVGMCVNALVAYLQLAGGDIPAAWSAGVDSTANKALGSGRYGGLVNQPAEAGTLYGLAIMAAMYVLRGRRLVLVLGVLIVGGVLTVSKIFLLVTLPLVAWRLFREPGRGQRLFAASAVAVGMWAWLATSSSQWVGVETLRGVLPSGPDSWVSVLGANRYGDTSTLEPVARAVMEGPSWLGFGAGGLVVAYDAQWVESLVVGGLVGLACILLAGVVMAHAWWRAHPSPERSLLGYALLVLSASSLGLPALTANRVATGGWLLLATLLVIVEMRPAREDESRSRELASRARR